MNQSPYGGKKDEIENICAVSENSSDDEKQYSSDEVPKFHRSSGLDTISAQVQTTPFAFTIGPDGFKVDQSIAPLFPADSSSGNFLRSSSASSSVHSSQALIDRYRQQSEGTSVASFDAPAEPESIMLGPESGSPISSYIKPRKRAASRHISSRSVTPGITASIAPSPRSSIISKLDSPPSSIDIPFRELTERVDFQGDHVGQLIREREQYLTYRQSRERVSGRLVSVEVELAMKNWVDAEKREGRMPNIIASDYLTNLGIQGNPRQLDLGPWIESMRDRMSPVEALLRAGIRPTEFPQYLIVHSLIHLDQLFHHYPNCDTFNPVGQVIDGEQLDEELDILFLTGPEKMEDIILSPEEQAIRLRQIEEVGIWESYEESVQSRRRRLKQDLAELQSIARVYNEEDDLEDDEQKEAEKIQEAMLSSWWTSEDGSADVNGFSDNDDAQDNASSWSSEVERPRKVVRQKRTQQKADETDPVRKQNGGSKRKSRYAEEEVNGNSLPMPVKNKVSRVSKKL